MFYYLYLLINQIFKEYFILCNTLTDIYFTSISYIYLKPILSLIEYNNKKVKKRFNK